MRSRRRAGVKFRGACLSNAVWCSSADRVGHDRGRVARNGQRHRSDLHDRQHGDGRRRSGLSRADKRDPSHAGEPTPGWDASGLSERHGLRLTGDTLRR
jgi:hypothetical protein